MILLDEIDELINVIPDGMMTEVSEAVFTKLTQIVCQLSTFSLIIENPAGVMP
jgi:hypothetical protein